ncbi:MAG: hypothetical protein MI739_02875 [Bacteroidales bacterium]|nr:hypothetical protein [Bacteroidales bacterium]
MKPIALLTILLLNIACWAQEKSNIKFNGFVDTYHALRSNTPNDFMSSRSRLRTELHINNNKTYLFTSLNAVHNSILPEQTKLELREAFFQYTNNSFDLKAGRQIATWGVADGVRITDIISPMDYTEFLARDYDDIRIPINALRLKYLKTDFNIELYFIPIPEFFIIPTNNKNPWGMNYKSETKYYFDKPQKTLRNSEYGGRFAFFLSGIDFSISALHTWNKMPALKAENIDSTIHTTGKFKQMDMLGCDISFPIRQFVVRAEAANYFGELIETERTNSFNYLLGIDWYPGNDWILMVQYYHKNIYRNSENISQPKSISMGTFSIQKKLLRNTLNLSSFSYIDFTNKGFFNRISADYSISDQIHIMCGYDWFYGDKGMFGIYKNNSEYWIKGKFCF